MQLRRHTDNALEAQRWQASQAAREQPERAAHYNALERMGELVQAGYRTEAKRLHEREVAQ